MKDKYKVGNKVWAIIWEGNHIVVREAVIKSEPTNIFLKVDDAYVLRHKEDHCDIMVNGDGNIQSCAISNIFLAEIEALRWALKRVDEYRHEYWKQLLKYE